MPFRQRSLSSWKRPQQPQEPVKLDQIIQDLSPPAVPSLSLAKTLAANVNGSVPPDALFPILDGICRPESPLALQTAGFDIFGTVWENHPPNLPSKERFDWLQLLHGQFSSEQFRALKAFVRAGASLGFEVQVITLLKDWIRNVEGNNTVKLVADYIVAQSATLPDTEVLAMLSFYESLVDQKLEVYMEIYLNYLDQISPHILDYTSVLQLLFRALAACSTLLPRISLFSLSLEDKPPIEKSICDRLLYLLDSAPYASTCLSVLKRCLFPTTSNWLIAYGAHRTLRLLIRKNLHILIARGYLQNKTAAGGWAGGVAGGEEIERELLERAWGPASSKALPTITGWDAQRLGLPWVKSIEAWVRSSEDESRTKILEEAALTLRDIIQELDLRDQPSLDDSEACTIGSILFWLSILVRGEKDRTTGEPYILPLSQPAAAHSALMSVIAHLLARDLPDTLPAFELPYPPETSPIPTSFVPSLHHTLLQISEHLSDMDTARVIHVMWSRGDLDVDFGFGRGIPSETNDENEPGWFDVWRFLLCNTPLPSPATAAAEDELQRLPNATALLLSSRRPLTSQMLMAALLHVYIELKEMDLSDARHCRRFLADLVWDFVDGCGIVAEEQEGSSSRRPIHDLSVSPGAVPLWKLMAEEVALRMIEWEKSEGLTGDQLTSEFGDPSVQRHLDLLLSLVAESPDPSRTGAEFPQSDVEEGPDDEDESDAKSVSTVDTFSRTPTFARAGSRRQAHQHHRSQSSSGSNTSNFHLHSSSSTTSAFTSPSLASPVTNYTSSPGHNYNTSSPSANYGGSSSSPSSGSPLASFVTSPPATIAQHASRHHRNFSDQLRELSIGSSSSSTSSPAHSGWERDRSADPASRERDNSTVRAAGSGGGDGDNRDVTRPTLPSVRSILSSFANSTHNSFRQDEPVITSPSAPACQQGAGSTSKQPDAGGNAGAGAVSALVSIFSHLGFAYRFPLISEDRRSNATKAILYIFESLIGLAQPPPPSSAAAAGDAPPSPSPSPSCRIAILQFLMRLRADRDHRVYLIGDESCDGHGQVKMLAGLIGRDDSEPPPVPETAVPSDSMERGRTDGGRPSVGERSTTSSTTTTSSSANTEDLRRTRPRLPERERDSGRTSSRGRAVHSVVGSGLAGIPRAAAGMPTVTAVSISGRTSRSRSRAATTLLPLSSSSPRALPCLWKYKFSREYCQTASNLTPDTPSSFLIVYDPTGPNNTPVLPNSAYLSLVLSILSSETNWEIVSFVLCHLPVQLANKHLFCGPLSRLAISKILISLCKGDIAAGVDWTVLGGLKPKDAQALAYHTLTVLIGYRRCFDLQQHHLLVETFFNGLSGTTSAIKCSIQALSLAVFELQPSMTKYLSRILDKLSQIMSNPDMAVFILCFLCMVASIPPLYSNFTEEDFKKVFAVALQYLQYHPKHGSSEDMPGSSWALSQHVRIVSYYLVYIWFLALKLPDRPKHVTFITRQLLLANEGNETVDDPTEVCFDWLARYTYASADPRPANSLLGDIVMKSGSGNDAAAPEHDSMVSEKTWILGTSVVTIRALPRLGWLEVLSRRPSGYTKLLCRVENAPMVGPGDPDPDVISVAASLLMERDPPVVQGEEMAEDRQNLVARLLPSQTVNEDGESAPPARPDPITGYVWSGSAPSQRRKEVVVDPAFFALQLSAYPDRMGPSQVRMLVPQAMVSKFFTSLDRIPVIDTHKVGIMYVAPGQTTEEEILRNSHGSPAYTRFLEGLGRLIDLRGQLDVYAGGLDPDEDGAYAYAWWDDTGQILYHTATMMPPPSENDPGCTLKKRHIGNDYVRIVWNDSGGPYRFDTLATQFQFVNIVIEPHSLGAIAAFSDNVHENEYFKVTVQGAEGMMEFTPVGDYKLISAENLPLLVRQVSLLADWFASVFAKTERDTAKVEVKTNWQQRLESIRRFKETVLKTRQTAAAAAAEEDSANNNNGAEEADVGGILAQLPHRDFTRLF